ncbi:MAG: response regulator [Sulfitobacter sp.]|nr:response regulator [Sulfitobacter sp.]
MPAALSKPLLLSGKSGKGQPVPVLILDDERFDRHRLARLCSGLEFPSAVSNAKTLDEFALHLEQVSFHLILVDYMLPDGTGLDALHMVRLNSRNLNAATLMISGQAKAGVTQEAEALGCAGYLTKDDLSPSRFAAAVKKALASVATPVPTSKQSYPVDEVEQLMSICAAHCARDVKPMISRMMRQIRDMRSSRGNADAPDLQALEQNCLTLWAYLIKMEREDGAELMSELVHNLLVTEAPAPSGKPSKPPSPFGRRPH